MSDPTFHDVYDPVATPNPAYDDDFEPAPAPRSHWNRRTLSQALLARARARQDAIADAFVDAILDGKISLFRLLIDLEQAAIAGEAEAQQAQEPTLASILLPMLERERNHAAAQPTEQAPKPDPDQPSESSPARPMLVAPHDHPPQSAATPQPGIADLDAAAQRPCRTRARKLPPRTPRRPSQRSLPAIQATPRLENLHASRGPSPAQNDSYIHTIQIVVPPPPRHRRKASPRHANDSKQDICAPYVP